MPDHLKLAPNVTVLPVVTLIDLEVERVLDGAREKLAEVVIVGTRPNGEFYFSSNKSDGPTVVWLLEQAKRKLLIAGDQG